MLTQPRSSMRTRRIPSLLTASAREATTSSVYICPRTSLSISLPARTMAPGFARHT